jgi:hypothetical protein
MQRNDWIKGSIIKRSVAQPAAAVDGGISPPFSLADHSRWDADPTAATQLASKARTGVIAEAQRERWCGGEAHLKSDPGDVYSGLGPKH